MIIQRLKSAMTGLAMATLLALGATPALADHQSHSQWHREHSQHQPGNRQPRYLGNQNGWRQSQRHANRHHAHNSGSHSRYHYGNRHHHGNRHHGQRHRGHNRHYGHRGHYRYHADGRDIAGAIIGGVVIYHLGRAILGRH